MISLCFSSFRFDSSWRRWYIIAKSNKKEKNNRKLWREGRRHACDDDDLNGAKDRIYVDLCMWVLSAKRYNSFLIDWTWSRASPDKRSSWCTKHKNKKKLSDELMDAQNHKKTAVNIIKMKWTTLKKWESFCLLLTLAKSGKIYHTSEIQLKLLSSIEAQRKGFDGIENW